MDGKWVGWKDGGEKGSWTKFTINLRYKFTKFTINLVNVPFYIGVQEHFYYSCCR